MGVLCPVNIQSSSGATPADPGDGWGGAPGNGGPLQRGQWQIPNLWTSPFHWESERPRRGGQGEWGKEGKDPLVMAPLKVPGPVSNERK